MQIKPIPVARRAAWYVAAGVMASFTGEALAQATLEEIVVTARKREESLQEVPIAVTAFSETALESIGVIRKAEP